MDVNWWVQHSLPPVTTSNSYYISRQTHRHLIKFGLKMPSTLLSFGCCAVVKQVDLQQQLRHCWKGWHRTTRTQTSPCNVYYAVHDNLARTVLLVVLGWQLQPCIGSSSSMDHGQRFLATRWRFLASCFDNFRLQKHTGLKLWGWHQRGKTSRIVSHLLHFPYESLKFTACISWTAERCMEGAPLNTNIPRNPQVRRGIGLTIWSQDVDAA